MKSRAVYLVVWDRASEKRTEVEDREKQSGLKYRNHSFSYWVDTVRSLSPDSEIIMLENKIDETQDLPSFQNQLAQLKVQRFEAVSSKERGVPLEHLRLEILKAARSLPDYNMRVPSSWWKVRKHLLEAASARQRTISIDEYETLCQDMQVPASTSSALLRLLHNTGIVFYDSNNFQGKIILDQ